MNRKIALAKLGASLGSTARRPWKHTWVDGLMTCTCEEDYLMDIILRLLFFIKIEEYMTFMSEKAEKGETESCSLTLCKQEVGPS